MNVSHIIPFLQCGKVQQGHEIGHECHHKLSQDFLPAASSSKQINIEYKTQEVQRKMVINIQELRTRIENGNQYIVTQFKKGALS